MHGCEVWAGLGWSRAGVEQGVVQAGSGRGLSMVEQGVLSGARLTRACLSRAGWSRA